MKKDKDFQQLFDEYIDECRFTRKLRPETLRSYEAVFKHFLRIMPHIINPELLTKEVVNRFFKILHTRERSVGKKMERTGIKDSTVKTYGRKLSTFFDWLRNNRYIEINPMDDIKLPEPKYEDERALKKDELEKIITAITQDHRNTLIYKRDMMMVYILLFCGLRRGEFLALQVRDVDFGKRLLTVRAETSKSKKIRYIPIHALVIKYVEEYLRELKKHDYKTQYLIVSSLKDKGLSRDGLKHWVNKLIKLSGVRFHLHRFRHTFACNLAKQGVSIIKIQKLLGHASLKMTMKYLRSINAEDLREDIDKLSFDDLA